MEEQNFRCEYFTRMVNPNIMAKKDISINENMDLGKEEAKPGIPAEEKNQEGFTEVKNANASGMGTMGRSAEEPTGVKNNEQGSMNDEV